MIVKDEKEVIVRCLDSVKHLIDYWVIVDTGSTDGTQKIIRKHLKDIPGELHERAWVNFGHNRDEAMKLARGKEDYLLFIDADDRLVFDEDFELPPLEADMYSIIQKEGSESTFREHHVYLLIRNNLDFTWNGVLHEFLACPTNKTQVLLTGLFCDYVNDGNRSKDPDKCEKDIEVLKKAALEDPTDSRSTYYLARTYWSIRDYSNAIPWFKKRVMQGGDPIEVYYALLYIGLGQMNSGESPDLFLDSFSRAHLYRPSRAEAIYEMGRYYTETNSFLTGYAILKLARTIPHSADNLFVETWVWDWGIPLQLFTCSLRLGYRQEAFELLQELLAEPSLPEGVRESHKLDYWMSSLQAEFLKQPSQPLRTGLL